MWAPPAGHAALPALLTADPVDRRVHTVGRIQPHLEARVVDPHTNATLPRGQAGWGRGLRAGLKGAKCGLLHAPCPGAAGGRKVPISQPVPVGASWPVSPSSQLNNLSLHCCTFPCARIGQPVCQHIASLL